MLMGARACVLNCPPHPNDAPCRSSPGFAAPPAKPRSRGAGIKDADMKKQQGTMTPNRRDLADSRSSGPSGPAPRPGVINDRRSTR